MSKSAIPPASIASPDTPNQPVPLSVAHTTDEEDYGDDVTLALSYERVKEARAAVARGDDVVYRIYCDGIFDLAHVGHFKMLEQAKKIFNDPSKVYLIAGVCSDEDTLKFKGKNVMDQATRMESLRHCKWVDEVIEAPWFITQEHLDKHQISFVAHDKIPYVSADSEDVYAFVKSQGKFLVTQRTNGISTTDLIVKIMRDYDDHVIRNLSRGLGKKQLNLGTTWALRYVAHAKEANFKSKFNEVKQQQKLVMDSLKQLTSCLQDRELVPFSSKSPKRANTSTTKDQGQGLCQEDDEQVAPQGGTFCDELTMVAKHSAALSVALFNTTCAALGYFNVFSYYDYFTQINNTDKKNQ